MSSVCFFGFQRREAAFSARSGDLSRQANSERSGSGEAKRRYECLGILVKARSLCMYAFQLCS